MQTLSHWTNALAVVNIALANIRIPRESCGTIGHFALVHRKEMNIDVAGRDARHTLGPECSDNPFTRNTNGTYIEHQWVDVVHMRAVRFYEGRTDSFQFTQSG